MSNEEYLRDFLIGVAAGAGIDMIFPVASDGTLANSVREAGSLGAPIALYTLFSDHDKAMARGCAYAAGSVLGQFLYDYVSR